MSHSIAPIAAQSDYQVRFARGVEGLAEVGASADTVIYVDALPGTNGEFTHAGECAVPGIRADLTNRTAAAEWMLARQVAAGARVSVAVIAASDGVEDTLAAGAVIDALAGLGIDFSSPEAAVVCASFTALERAVGHLLSASIAGRTLVAAGKADIVSRASGIDSQPRVVALEWSRRTPSPVRGIIVKAVVNGTVVAEAPKEDLISMEGNWYFPPSSLKVDLLTKSNTPYTCPWKGECQYFNVKDGATTLKDRAWSYPNPYPSAFDRVGKDFSNYVAFWKEVSVVE